MANRMTPRYRLKLSGPTIEVSPLVSFSQQRTATKGTSTASLEATDAGIGKLELGLDPRLSHTSESPA